MADLYLKRERNLALSIPSGTTNSVLNDPAAAFRDDGRRDRDAALNAANSAAAEGDTDKALLIWATTQAEHASHPLAWLRGAAALVRLGRLHEAIAVLAKAEKVVLDDVHIFAERARLTYQARGPAEALPLWRIIRQRFPDNTRSYIGLASCLRELARYHEAKQTAIDGERKFPTETLFVIEQAKISEAMQAWNDAHIQWAATARAMPENPRAVSGQIRALSRLFRFEEAERLCVSGMRSFPNDVTIVVDAARCAEGADRPDIALERWEHLSRRFPDSWSGYSGGATCLQAMGRVDDAERLLEDGIQRFPNVPRLRFGYAQVARDRRDYAEALHRWESARAQFPKDWYASKGVASSLSFLRRYGDAEALLTQCLDDFPDDGGPLIDITHLLGRIDPSHRGTSLASLRQRFDSFLEKRGPTPALLGARAQIAKLEQDFSAYRHELAAALQSFPADPGLKKDWVLACELVSDGEIRVDGGLHDSGETLLKRQILAAEATQSSTEPPSIAEIMRNFESLGGGNSREGDRCYGCEFGLLQRAAGVESLGLMRWSGISPENLVRLLDNRLAGIGDDLALNVNINDEWAFIDRNYNISCNHTNMFRNAVPETRAQELLVKRQKFLARKLILDLGDAEKVFVYRVLGPSLTADRVERLATAVNSYGPNTLLYVQTADGVMPPSAVKWIRPGLMIGYIDRFRSGEDKDIANTTGWFRICENAYALWRAASPELVRYEP